jgi:hypothetical protein
MVRYSFPVGLFHSLLHAGLIPAHAHNSHTLNFPFPRSKRRTLDGRLQRLNGRGKMKAILL